MSKNAKLLSCIAISIIVFALTVLIYLLADTDKTSIDRTAFAFIMVSEIIMCAVTTLLIMLQSRSDKTIISTGIVSVLLVYFILTVLIGLFRNIFENNIPIFIIINSVFIALAGIVCILLNAAILKVSHTDKN